jgi:hypothetical protein
VYGDKINQDNVSGDIFSQERFNYLMKDDMNDVVLEK